MDIRTIIQEAVRNAVLLKSLLRKMLREVQKVATIKGPVRYEDDRHVYHLLHIGNITQETYEAAKKIIDRYVPEMLRNGYIMSYHMSKKRDIDYGEDDPLSSDGTLLDTFHVDFIIRVKDQHTQRIIPQRYVYHFSPMENRQSILKNGLLPSAWKDSPHWSIHSEVAYEKAIFAVNTENDAWGQKGWDRWRIDTSMIPNKWWRDMNFHERPDLVMTYDAIPPQALRLV